MIKERDMLEKVSKWNPRFEHQKVIFGNIMVKSTLLDRIKEAQKKIQWYKNGWKRCEKGNCLISI